MGIDAIVRARANITGLVVMYLVWISGQSMLDLNYRFLTAVHVQMLQRLQARSSIGEILWERVELRKIWLDCLAEVGTVRHRLDHGQRHVSRRDEHLALALL